MEQTELIALGNCAHRFSQAWKSLKSVGNHVSLIKSVVSDLENEISRTDVEVPGHVNRCGTAFYFIDKLELQGFPNPGLRELAVSVRAAIEEMREAEKEMRAMGVIDSGK